MLLGCICDALVLRCDSVNKAIGGRLQRIDTLGTVASAHLIIHRTGSIQHHHDVERLAGNRCIGCRRDGRQRGQEIRLFAFSGFLDRFVGPNSADVLSCSFLAVIATGPVLPVVSGVVVDDLFTHRRSVHSGTGPGVGLGQHGECCGWQYQHYGQYHRQETPRVPAHRVSLLAGSDLASA